MSKKVLIITSLIIVGVGITSFFIGRSVGKNKN
jgi:hypothetical protein